MTITHLESKVLTAYQEDDYVSDYGWEDPEAGAWVDVLSDTVKRYGIDAKSFSGIMSSLVKKGLMITNGEDCSLTLKGIELLKTLAKTLTSGV